MISFLLGIELVSQQTGHTISNSTLFSSVFFLFVAFPFLLYVGSGIFARSQLSMVQPTAREGPRGLLFKRLYRCDVVALRQMFGTACRSGNKIFFSCPLWASCVFTRFS